MSDARVTAGDMFHPPSGQRHLRTANSLEWHVGCAKSVKKSGDSGNSLKGRVDRAYTSAGESYLEFVKARCHKHARHTDISPLQPNDVHNRSSAIAAIMKG